MRILFIGDVVGRSGRTIVTERLPDLISKWKLDLVVINGENAAGGFGITEVIYNELIDAGADAITLGNHAWDQREALVFIERAPRLVRPLNYPKGTPGRGAALLDTKNGKRALVINAMGRIFMDPLDDPFAAIERELCAEVRCGRNHHRFPLRGDERKTGDGLFRRWTRKPRRRYAHARAHRRRSRIAGWDRLHVGRRHDCRLRFHHRHEQGRAAQPLPAQTSWREVRTFDGSGDIVRGRGRDR
jgi:hypothetical protein